MHALDPSSFLHRLFAALENDGIHVDPFVLDHLCYRVEDHARYTSTKATLLQRGVLLGEHLIGGRPIATFRMHTPFLFRDRMIDVIELPAPKSGSPYAEGFEHAEFVVHEDPVHFAARYPQLAWDSSGADKPINANVRLNYDGFSVKFHARSLEEVIARENGADR